ncbi:MAG TPA: DUF4595 domain-containing protein [Chitinophagales bacterium]|nr:DUF4595 domain-containing protein [Chitinophagales bacterium]
MNRILLVSATLLLFLASACKKDKTATNCRLTAIKSNFDTAYIAYNSNGRVVSYGDVQYGLYSFFYPGGLTAFDSVETAGSKKADCNISLDANGRVTFMTRNVQSLGATLNYTFQFQYNADGYITLCEQTYGASSTGPTAFYKDSMVYNNGNLVAKYTFTRDLISPYALQSYLNCTYSTQQNKIGHHAFFYFEEPISVTDGWNAFYHLFGNGPANLPLKTTVYNNTGAVTYILDYTYLTDENGYPTEASIVRSVNSTNIFNRKFSYSCE